MRIRDLGAVMRLAGGAVELAPMRWGFPPPRPGAGPIFNFRSEGRSFASTLRCLVPASAFFEFTGAKSPKTRWRFTAAHVPFMAIAGVWRPAQDNQPPDFSLLTTAPGADVAPYHNRQIVVLPPEDWGAWLALSKPEAQLLRPSPAGTLAVGA